MHERRKRGLLSKTVPSPSTNRFSVQDASSVSSLRCKLCWHKSNLWRSSSLGPFSVRYRHIRCNLRFSFRRRTAQLASLRSRCKPDAGNTTKSFKNISVGLPVAAETVSYGEKKKREEGENDPLQNSVSSTVKGAYFITNVVPPKQILFLNLSLSWSLEMG